MAWHDAVPRFVSPHILLNDYKTHTKSCSHFEQVTVYYIYIYTRYARIHIEYLKHAIRTNKYCRNKYMQPITSGNVIICRKQYFCPYTPRASRTKNMSKWYFFRKNMSFRLKHFIFGSFCCKFGYTTNLKSTFTVSQMKFFCSGENM